MAFSKSLPKGQIPVGCKLCDSGNKIEWNCTDCHLLMCDRCKNKVHLRIAKDHKIVNIKDIGQHEDSWDSFVFKDLKCDGHPSEHCSLYCKTCSNVICLKCAVKVHNGHNFVDEEEFVYKKEALKKGQYNVQMNLGKLSSEKVKMITPEEIENQKLLQNILDQKEKIFKAVEQYADNLVQDVNKHFKTMRDEKDVKIDQETKKMQVKNEALESIITSRDFVKFFRDFDELNVSLNEDMSEDFVSISSVLNFVPGEVTALNLGTLEESKGLKESRLTSQFELKVNDQWTTDLRSIHYILRCPDGTLWIGDNANDVLQHIKLEQEYVKVLSSFSLKIYGIEDISGNILVSAGETRLKLIDGRTKEITDSVFVIGESFISRGIHITKDRKVVITARSPGAPFSNTGRSVVIVMDQAGNYLAEYENDRSNRRLLTAPMGVTSSSNGNIFVIDRLHEDSRGRIVVLCNEGNTVRIYTGHHEVNTKDKPLKPTSILALPSDNIMLTDWMNNTIHILNPDGHFLLYYNLNDTSIRHPYTLALFTPGHLYIGCAGLNLPYFKTFRGKLYEVDYSGIF